jgi:hypothetical protein
VEKNGQCQYYSKPYAFTQSMTCIYTTSTRGKDGRIWSPPKNAMDDSEKDGLWDGLEVDGRVPYGRMTYIWPTDRPGRRQQETEKV